MSKIVIYADPDTREVEIDVPVPSGGAIKPEGPVQEGKQATISFVGRSPEQLAHYVFWADGTQSRIQALIRDGRGAGLRQTLKWLILMRIEEAYKKTGFKYSLEVIWKKEDWEKLQKDKAENGNWL
jgi:hypothetical protein